MDGRSQFWFVQINKLKASYFILIFKIENKK